MGHPIDITGHEPTFVAPRPSHFNKHLPPPPPISEIAQIPGSSKGFSPLESHPEQEPSSSERSLPPSSLSSSEEKAEFETGEELDRRIREKYIALGRVPSPTVLDSKRQWLRSLKRTTSLSRLTRLKRVRK
jgi:hypothetical protein